MRLFHPRVLASSGVLLLFAALSRAEPDPAPPSGDPLSERAESDISSPFNGVPFVPACAIEAEQFDRGGESVGYHRPTGPKPDRLYRKASIEIDPCDDAGGGYCLVTRPGEWFNYSIDVQESDLFTLEARVACAGPGGAFHFEFDGVNQTGPILVPDTGGSQSWRTVVKSGIRLKPGPQIMRLVIESRGRSGRSGNFNRFCLYPTPSHPQSGRKTIDITRPPYLAVGDGKAESGPANRKAFQDAVDDLEDAGGGVIKVPAGVYVLEQEWPNERPGAGAYENAAVLIRSSRVAFQGIGPRSVLKAANRSTTLLYFGDPQSDEPLGDFSIRNLAFAGRPHHNLDGKFEAGGVYNGDWTIGALVSFHGTHPRKPMTRIDVSSCSFVNPSVNAIEFGRVDGANFTSNRFIFFDDEEPYGKVTDAYDRSTRPFPINVVAIRSGSEDVRNVVITDNIFDGNPKLSERRRSTYAADGFVWLTDGGNWFVARNQIRNHALEAVQLNAGPFAVVENRFETPTDNASSCALYACRNDTGDTLSSPQSIRSFYSFAGNIVEGGATGCYCERPAHLASLTAPFNLNVSDNSFELFTRPKGDSGSMVLARSALHTTVSGNTLLKGGKGVHLVDGCREALITHNDFSGARQQSILTQETGASLQRVFLIGNILASGSAAHVWIDGGASDFDLILRQNRFVDLSGRPNGPILRLNQSRVKLERE